MDEARPKDATAAPRARGHEAFAWTRAPFDRLDLAVMAFLSVFGALVAWPNRAQYLTEWDSNLFALASEEYDLLDGQPHPPGYPVFVFLCRLARLAIPEANAAIVAVALGAGAASIGLVYGLGREFAARAPSAAAALLFAFSPNLLFNEAVALSYTCEGLLSVALAWTALRVRRAPTRWNVRLLAAIFALGVGLRPSIAFYLTPLVAWAALPRPFSAAALARRAVDAAAGGILVGLSWWVPMVLAGGGARAWWETSRYQTRIVIFESTVFNDGLAALQDHAGRIVFFLRAERPALALILVVAALGAMLLLNERWRQELRPPARRAAAFLAIWTVPSLLFFAFVFSGWVEGPRGYVLVFLPALYVGLAMAAQAVVPRLQRPMAPATGRMLAAIVLLGILSPAPALGAQADAILTKQVRDHDDWSRSWLGLRDELPPEETAIFTSYSWVFVKWYLPEYLQWGILRPPRDDGPGKWSLIEETRHRQDDVPMYEAHLRGHGGPEHPIPAAITRIVVFDFQLAGENGGTRFLAADVEVLEGRLSTGWRYLYVVPDAEHPTLESLLAPEYRP